MTREEATREILFRGKRVDNGEWVYGYVFDDGILESKRMFIGGLVITDSDGNSDGRYEVGVDFHEVIPETRGQYTGLTDRNGVKIFEGDILRYGDTVHRVVFEQRYGTAYFGLVYGPDETLPFGYYQDLRQLEVIGNIHDNQDLLEGGSKE